MEELNLGKKLQAIRTSKKISVRKLAAMTNLTASMISQIENGAVNPSIPTLRTISSALETPIYYFFKDEDNASVVVTQSTRMVLGNKQEPSVVYELLTPDTRGEIEFCMMVIPPKAYSCREPKGHFGEEVAFFYSGEEVQLEIDGDSYTLHHEDSIRIPGGAMHRWYNPTDETVQVIFAVVVVLFLIAAVVPVFRHIAVIPHILGGLAAKVGVLLDVVGNRTLKGIQNLFVGILAEDLPKGYGQAADFCVALGDQEPGRGVAGFFAVALVDHVAVVEESVPDPCGGSDQFSGEAIRLAARGNQFLEKLIDAVFILRHFCILQRVFCVFRGVFPFGMHILPSLSYTIKRL